MSRPLSSRVKGLGLLGAAAALSLTMAGPALASDDSSVTVTGGTLHFETDPLVGVFSGVTLNGQATTTTAVMDDFTIIDARGTGQGWVLEMEASVMKEWDGVAGDYKEISPRTLAAGSLVIEPLSVTADGTSSPLPEMETVSVAIDEGAVILATAEVDEGMGTYDFTDADTGDTEIEITLSLPANTYAAEYRSDLTITVMTPVI